MIKQCFLADQLSRSKVDTRPTSGLKLKDKKTQRYDQLKTIILVNLAQPPGFFVWQVCKKRMNSTSVRSSRQATERDHKQVHHGQKKNSSNRKRGRQQTSALFYSYSSYGGAVQCSIVIAARVLSGARSSSLFAFLHGDAATDASQHPVRLPSK